MRLDARAIKAMVPGSHATIPGCPGLRLEITATTKTWVYRYNSPINGAKRQKKIGTWPALSQSAAERAWEDLRTIRDSGRDPALEHKQARAEAKEAAKKPVSYRVNDLISDYMEGHVKVNRNEASYKELSRKFRKLCADLNGKLPEEVTRTVAYEFLEKMQTTPRQAALIRQELAAAWDLALDAGRLPESAHNWWRQVMRGKLKSAGRVKDGKRVVTTRDLQDFEVGKLINWLPNLRSRSAQDLLILYLWTGARGGELVQMETTEFADEPDGLWWTCPKRKTKNCRRKMATDYRVPLVGRAEAIVRGRIEDAKALGTTWLFPAEKVGARLPHRAQTSLYQSISYQMPGSKQHPGIDRPRCPVDDWSPHDLRRTARTLLSAIDCPPDVAEVIIGHMLKGVEGTYNRHSYDVQKRRWLTNLANHLEECAAKFK